MDERLVTRDELAGYATIADLGYVNERVDGLQTMAYEDRESFRYNLERTNGIVGVLNEAVSAIEYRPVYYEEFERINEEIAQIKEALIDIQDSLRRLGLDDMSQRLGDLNLLLA